MEKVFFEEVNGKKNLLLITLLLLPVHGYEPDSLQSIDTAEVEASCKDTLIADAILDI